MAKIVLTGDKKLDAQLKKLEANANRKMVRQATREAAKTILLPLVKEYAPEDTGELESTFKVRAITKRRTMIGHRVIGAFPAIDEKDPFHGVFQELGTKHTPARHFSRDAAGAAYRPSTTLFIAKAQELCREALAG